MKIKTFNQWGGKGEGPPAWGRDDSCYTWSLCFTVFYKKRFPVCVVAVCFLIYCQKELKERNEQLQRCLSWNHLRDRDLGLQREGRCPQTPSKLGGSVACSPDSQAHVLKCYLISCFIYLFVALLGKNKSGDICPCYIFNIYCPSLGKVWNRILQRTVEYRGGQLIAKQWDSSSFLNSFIMPK